MAGQPASEAQGLTACILVFRSPILGPSPSTFLLNEGAWDALWEASCPEPLPTSPASPIHLLGLNGSPFLLGLQPSPTLLTLRRLPGLHRKQTKCRVKSPRQEGAISPRSEQSRFGRRKPQSRGEGRKMCPTRPPPPPRYQARKPRKGELGLFLFCTQPLPVSKLRAATWLTPPWPPPSPPRSSLPGT